jgi:hypothetical protein
MKLVRERLPAEFEVTGDVDAYPLVAAGMLSRMTTTMQTLFALQPYGRMADANTLVRSLYEHLVYLAWLAAAPGPERLEAWRRDDIRIRIAAASEAAERGVELLTEAERAALKVQYDGLTGDRLQLVGMAADADTFWVGKLPGLEDGASIGTLRGLYTVLYRQYSGTAHPTFRGLNLVVEDVTTTRRRVVLERRYAGRGPAGIATVIYALALYITAASFGWPSAHRVTAVFERFPRG